MLVVRPVPVIKNRVHCLQILWVRVEPCIYVLRLYGNNAPVMSCCSYFWRRFICYGGE
ncbi:MAG: hypothetical protein QOI13_3021 [Paraburkholderia sp.]|nr:hypothetical protein [Paraburkholderia sp.]